MTEILTRLDDWRTLTEIASAYPGNKDAGTIIGRLMAAGKVERSGKFEQVKSGGESAKRWVFRYRRAER